jgi:hypothetical protein
MRNDILKIVDTQRYDGGLIFFMCGCVMFGMMLLGHVVTCQYNHDVIQGVYSLSLLLVLSTYTFGGLVMTLSFCSSCGCDDCFCCENNIETKYEKKQKRIDHGPSLCMYLILIFIPCMWFSLTLLTENNIHIFSSTMVGGARVDPKELVSLNHDGSGDDGNNMATCLVGSNLTFRVECAEDGGGGGSSGSGSGGSSSSSRSSSDAAGGTQKRVRNNVTQCVYWNMEIKDWSTDGCQVVEENDVQIICGCSHLTDLTSGLGETQDLLGRVFTAEYANQLFVVHWYVVVVIFSILGMFLVLGK